MAPDEAEKRSTALLRGCILAQHLNELQQQILRRRTAAHLVDVWLLKLEARDRLRPALAGTPGGQLQELAGAAAAHLMHTRPSTALHGPSLHFWPVMAACPPASQVPPRLRSSLTALLLMHYGQRPKTSPGAVFEAVL